MSMDYQLRILTIVVLLLWFAYWRFEEVKSEKIKPTQKTASSSSQLKRIIALMIEFLVVLELAGFSILPLVAKSTSIQILGLIIVVVGAAVSISARRVLGNNWAHAAEYQVKPSQSLVTNGIYAHVRHPIYTGLILGFAGSLLVAKSYLILFSLVIIAGAYVQAKKEEKLLLRHFGDEYKDYMKRTKMFIPHLW